MSGTEENKSGFGLYETVSSIWWVLIEEFVAMGWMRTTANGVPFLGCRRCM